MYDRGVAGNAICPTPPPLLLLRLLLLVLLLVLVLLVLRPLRLLLLVLLLVLVLLVLRLLGLFGLLGLLVSISLRWLVKLQVALPDPIPRNDRSHETSGKVEDNNDKLHKDSHTSHQDGAAGDGVPGRVYGGKAADDGVDKATGEEGQADGDGNDEAGFAGADVADLQEGEEGEDDYDEVEDEEEDVRGFPNVLAGRSFGGAGGEEFDTSDDGEDEGDHEGQDHQGGEARGNYPSGHAGIPVRRMLALGMGRCIAGGVKDVHSCEDSHGGEAQG